MHSKRRYKICICSVILARGTWVFSELQGLQFIFPKILDAMTYYESETFPDSSRHHNFESENFRFPFFYEK